MEERETIKYRDLSLYLKLASIGGFIYFLVVTALVVFGFIIGITS